MGFPNIKPIILGRDGWSVLYDTPASRLLFLCGLRAQRILYSPVQQRTMIDWRLSPDAARRFDAITK
jgi:hypothetical protein